MTAALNALLVPDPEPADRLAVAAWTTLGVPSAAAAVLATVWYHFPHPTGPAVGDDRTRGLPPRSAGAGRPLRAAAVLVVNGLLDPAALQFMLPATAIGGGLGARRWARTHRSR